MTESGYTMIPDLLVSEFGLITAAVFGVVRRYEQMGNGKCTASQARIGERCGISRGCAIAHLNLLVKAGYLTQETIFGVGVVYKTTSKLTYSSGEQEVFTKSTPTCTSGEHKETLLRDSLRDSSCSPNEHLTPPTAKANDPADEFTWAVRQATGIPGGRADAAAIADWFQKGATIEDVKAAMAWRSENGLPAVRVITKLSGGVETARLRRIQGSGNGKHQPEGNIFGL